MITVVLSFELQQQQQGSAAATNDKEFLLDSFVIFIAVIYYENSGLHL